MQDATGVVKSIAKKDITAKKVHDLVNNGGSWLMVPTSLHTLKESDVDWDKLDYCSSIMERLKVIRQDCFGVGLMVSKDTDDNERYFEYRAWNKEDICIHNEEDAGRLAYITTVFTIPSFEDSNEEALNRENY